MTAQPHPAAVRDRDDDQPQLPAATTRLAAVRRFLEAVVGHLPPERLTRARALATRADERIGLSHEYTVVALAGATGSGKSSLFNALAGRELSPVGARRPTTGEAYACVWGQLADAADLLDWLKVAPAHRFTRESLLDGDEQAGMRGLVLLDLPDFDSLDTGHAPEVSRLLSLVDVTVWVMDPQKYADRVIHEEHLPTLRPRRDVTVVALNQADLLTSVDLERLLADLRRLLAEGALGEVFTIATSAVDAPAGLAQLRARLEEAVAGDTLAARLHADMDAADGELADLVGPRPAEEIVDRVARRELADGLARVAGMTAAAEVVEHTYRRRGAAMTGWAPLRWAGRLRRDPLQDLDPEPDGAREATPTRGAGWAVGQRAAADLVVREVAAHVSLGLPDPWPGAVTTAARSRLDELPDALDGALVTVDLDGGPVPRWWRAAAAAQWLFAGVAVVGLGWLGFAGVLRLFGLSWAGPDAAGVPVPALLAGGGILAGVLLALVARPLLRRSAGRARARVADQLRAALAAVGREYVLAPVRQVVDAYVRARESLAAARGAR